MKVVASFEYSIAGKNQALNFDMANRIKKSLTQELVWEFDLKARSTTSDVVVFPLSSTWRSLVPNWASRSVFRPPVAGPGGEQG